MSGVSDHALTDNQVWSAMQIDKTETNSWVASQYGYKEPEIREDGSVISHRGVILTNSFTDWDKEQGVHEIHIDLDDLVKPGEEIGKETFLEARVKSYWLPYGADGEPDPGHRLVKNHPDVAEVVTDILKNGAQSEQERDMAKLFNKSRHEYDEDLKRFLKTGDENKMTEDDRERSEAVQFSAAFYREAKAAGLDLHDQNTPEPWGAPWLWDSSGDWQPKEGESITDAAKRFFKENKDEIKDLLDEQHRFEAEEKEEKRGMRI